jgi:glycolate oxidase iron-sulfur subunit
MRGMTRIGPGEKSRDKRRDTRPGMATTRAGERLEANVAPPHGARSQRASGVLGIYDQHRPPSPELIDKCVHCGFCLPVCPTYVLWNEEMDSPRGRIYLMKMGAEGGVATMDEKFVGHFDQCLGCMACMTACPSGVEYGKLIEATRAQIERNYERPFWDRVFRELIFAVFPYPNRLRLLLLPLWLYQKSGLRWLLRKALRLLPRQVQKHPVIERLLMMEALLPDISLACFSDRFPERISPQERPRRRVGLLLGCVQRVFFSNRNPLSNITAGNAFGNVNAAAVRVLVAAGCEVVIPREQGCCGALMTHAGREAEAIAAARRVIDVFERAHVDNIVVNAAGCGSAIKEYVHLLRNDPAYAERARAVSEKCRDITELLVELGFDGPFQPLRLKAAYQDACHMQHAQGIRTQPRQLLKAIPEMELIELPESAICCGSAGIYNLVKPGPARDLADRKAEHVVASGADVMVSANPGCLMQIASGLRRKGSTVPVLHIVEVLNSALADKAEPAS